MSRLSGIDCITNQDVLQPQPGSKKKVRTVTKKRHQRLYQRLPINSNIEKPMRISCCANCVFPKYSKTLPPTVLQVPSNPKPVKAPRRTSKRINSSTSTTQKENYTDFLQSFTDKKFDLKNCSVQIKSWNLDEIRAYTSKP